MTNGRVSMVSKVPVKPRSRPPREVVLEVAALGPLRDSGDVIRVVLIAHDPDGLAAFVLEALAEDLYQQVGDIVPAAGLGKQFVGD